MNSGLYAFAGDSATATDAACAKRLEEPMTNVSNMYLGLSLLPPVSGAGGRAGLSGPRVSPGGATIPVAPMCIGSPGEPARPGPLSDADCGRGVWVGTAKRASSPSGGGVIPTIGYAPDGYARGGPGSGRLSSSGDGIIAAGGVGAARPPPP